MADAVVRDVEQSVNDMHVTVDRRDVRVHHFRPKVVVDDAACRPNDRSCESWLVSCCFKPSQSQRITSVLKELVS